MSEKRLPWHQRFLRKQWLVKLSSLAFNAPSKTSIPSAWLWFHQADLPGFLANLAEEKKRDCLGFGDPLDGMSQYAEAHRHYLSLNVHYRGWRRLTRYAVFGPASLRYHFRQRYHWDERFLSRDFTGFHCNTCGVSGSAQDAVHGTWQEGEGRAMMWGDTLDCPACGTRIAARLIGVNN